MSIAPPGSYEGERQTLGQTAHERLLSSAVLHRTLIPPPTKHVRSSGPSPHPGPVRRSHPCCFSTHATSHHVSIRIGKLISRNGNCAALSSPGHGDQGIISCFWDAPGFFERSSACLRGYPDLLAENFVRGAQSPHCQSASWGPCRSARAACPVFHRNVKAQSLSAWSPSAPLSSPLLDPRFLLRSTLRGKYFEC